MVGPISRRVDWPFLLSARLLSLLFPPILQRTRALLLLRADIRYTGCPNAPQLASHPALSRRLISLRFMIARASGLMNIHDNDSVRAARAGKFRYVQILT